MKKEITGTFISLNPKAKIFEEIMIQQPKWWSLLSKDKELYIEIRKDNYINAYYNGGSVAKIDYENGFVALTHQKYLGDYKPRGKTKKGKDKFEYAPLDLTTLDESQIGDIKNHINKDYIRHIDGENLPEKLIQAKMITRNTNYIDSEIQFNQDVEIDNLRVDLVELEAGILSFVELKTIFDSRLRNDKKRNLKTPEIIEQMEKYKLFINKYKAELNDYYKKLLEIKQTLGLTSTDNTIINLNKTPKLIIADTYIKMTKEREERISDIKELLENHKIDYDIIKWK